MQSSIRDPWRGMRAALATMHGKQREIPRRGSALDTARAKARLALALAPHARIGIASEGSFGPDPQLHFIPAGEELVVAVDREFARQVRFPSHALLVMGIQGGKPDSSVMLTKGIHDHVVLGKVVTDALARWGAAHIETDMRAQHNPTRMRAIRRATLDLLRRYRSHCPDCGRPGYAIVAQQAGLPCEDCGAPTMITRARLWRCAGCGHRSEVASSVAYADARYCDCCNP